MTGTADIARCFVAIPVPKAVREALAAAQHELRKSEARVKWVAPEKIHLTLVFLGDLFASRLPAFGEALEEAAAGVEPFPLEVRGLGTFGKPRAPRVVWAGLPGVPEALGDLHGRLLERFAPLGFRREARAFHPHLTLGRVKSARGVAALTAAMASANNTPFGRVRVTRIHLMESTLSSTGADYAVRHTALLKGVREDGQSN